MIKIPKMKQPKSCDKCSYKYIDNNVVVCSLLESLGKRYEAALCDIKAEKNYMSRDCPLNKDNKK